MDVQVQFHSIQSIPSMVPTSSAPSKMRKESTSKWAACTTRLIHNLLQQKISLKDTHSNESPFIKQIRLPLPSIVNPSWLKQNFAKNMPLTDIILLKYGVLRISVCPSLLLRVQSSLYVNILGQSNPLWTLTLLFSLKLTLLKKEKLLSPVIKVWRTKEKPSYLTLLSTLKWSLDLLYETRSPNDYRLTMANFQ